MLCLCAYSWTWAFWMTLKVLESLHGSKQLWTLFIRNNGEKLKDEQHLVCWNMAHYGCWFEFDVILKVFAVTIWANTCICLKLFFSVSPDCAVITFLPHHFIINSLRMGTIIHVNLNLNCFAIVYHFESTMTSFRPTKWVLKLSFMCLCIYILRK